MSRVSLSAKDVRLLLIAIDDPALKNAPGCAAAIAKLRTASAPRPEKPQRKQRLAAKQSKREAKNAETARIRAACVERAAGACECRCGRPIDGETAHMDHFAGRVRLPQSVETCWMLHPDCDRAKTLNKPTAIYWHLRFLMHAKRHGYRTAANYAEVRIEASALADAAEQAGKAVRR